MRLFSWMRNRAIRAYERLLYREISGVPSHVAIIQDGNRRYARQHGNDSTHGHEAGAKTTEQVLEWCEELGVEELTLYAFSTENFNRPIEEQETLFDLLETKLTKFADSDRIHESKVSIRAIGAIDRLPDRVQAAVEYAERQTQGYDRFRINIALAYGGRAELLDAARDVASAVADGKLDPNDIEGTTIEQWLPDRPAQDVDLIVRTGGDERTSNFLPWHANGNEAAVFFCAPYWPEFSKIDLLRAIRTYESREASWRRTRMNRAIEIIRTVGRIELEEATVVASRLRNHLPRGQATQVVEELERTQEPAD